jgi:hypothetical protein
MAFNKVKKYKFCYPYQIHIFLLLDRVGWALAFAIAIILFGLGGALTAAATRGITHNTGQNTNKSFYLSSVVNMLIQGFFSFLFNYSTDFSKALLRFIRNLGKQRSSASAATKESDSQIVEEGRVQEPVTEKESVLASTSVSTTKKKKNRNSYRVNPSK